MSLLHMQSGGKSGSSVWGTSTRKHSRCLMLRKAPSDNPNMASYQFQIRARPPNGRWRSSLLLGLAVGKEHIVSGMSQVQCMNRIVMLMREAVPDELKGCPMHVCAFCPKACLPACQPNFPIVTQDCICTWCPHYAACNVRVGNRPLLMYVDYVP